MTERPILFSAPMITAILDGRKTQTRRVVKPQPDGRAWYPKPGHSIIGADELDLARKMLDYCPYGRPGDRLYVKEKHSFLDVRKSAMSQFPNPGGGVGPDVWNLCVEYSDGTENDTFSVEGDKPTQTR